MHLTKDSPDLVPTLDRPATEIELTDEMLEAGAEALRRSFRNGDEGMAYACFMAMVRASPGFR